MGYGCHHSDSVIINRYDLGGVLNVLAKGIGDLRHEDMDERSMYAGAFNALYICESHEWRDQAEFMHMFRLLATQLPGEED